MPRDLAMNVVLPEVDGRIFANVIAFKERGESDTGFAPTTFRPVEDRIAATANLARAWVRLRGGIRWNRLRLISSGVQSGLARRPTPGPGGSQAWRAC